MFGWLSKLFKSKQQPQYVAGDLVRLKGGLKQMMLSLHSLRVESISLVNIPHDTTAATLVHANGGLMYVLFVNWDGETETVDLLYSQDRSVIHVTRIPIREIEFVSHMSNERLLTHSSDELRNIAIHRMGEKQRGGCGSSQS